MIRGFFTLISLVVLAGCAGGINPMEHGPAIPVVSEPDAFLQAQSEERVGAG